MGDHIKSKFKNFLVKLLAMTVRGVLASKRFVLGFFGLIRGVLVWTGRHFFLPVLVSVYRLVTLIRRRLAPAERHLLLIVTHRGVLHLALIIIAVMIAGGNIYAQNQSTVSSGEGTILYQYITGEDEVIEESKPASVNEQRYVANAVDNAETVPDGSDYNFISDQDWGTDTMTELGALMPNVIPGGAAAVHRTQTEEYVVQSGDTFSGIADKFGISIATILWANKLTVRDYIQPGQKLVILPTTGISYSVKAGDTISKIAAAYSADPEEIKSFNNIIDEGALQKGQTLIIPGGKIAAPVAPKPKVSTLASPSKIFTKPADAIDSGKTDMIWPAATHYISQPYGIWSRLSRGTHSGVDLAAPTGTAIYAADDGIVTHSGCGASCKKSYGLYIDIDHGNGIMTRYGHASKLLVSVGEQVRRGQVIALMGSTGLSTGPHLHFEVRLNGRYTNPMPYIR